MATSSQALWVTSYLDSNKAINLASQSLQVPPSKEQKLLAVVLACLR
jgi:hypothetical protein